MRITQCAARLAALAAGTAGVGAAFADASALNLLFPFDSTNTAGWANSMAPNDDGSSAAIPLPFEFCFYDTPRTSLYINNNGNVSFSGPFFTYTATGFPDATFDMIAPFWADVDTRNQSNGGIETNQVWHRSFDTDSNPGDDVFVVTWDAVGYYQLHNDRRNTFQVALALDPNKWGLGLNAAFSYGNMDWTTGDASGGAGGFGGVAATVGINRGDGFDYDQLGRFDHPGFDYNGNGTTGFTSGVDWLDNTTHFFNACEGDVPEPATLSLLALAGLVAFRRR